MHLLLLEDDIDLGQAVAEHLEAHGHTVSWMKLCSQADHIMSGSEVDMALIDLRLPDGDGVELLKSWRARGERRPAIMLTARDQISDRIKGLQAGADDYLVKPFDLDELVARVQAVARRAGISDTQQVLRTGRVSLDFENKVARMDGAMVTLTAMEWALLSCLAARPGHTLSRQQIRQAIFQPGRMEAESNSMEVIISRLRRKLGPELISTHRGLGYRLDL
jgi:two-component system, OmpR family, response regulator